MRRVAYLLRRFPGVNTVFILNEVTGLIDAGYPPMVISLDRPRKNIIHRQYFDYGLDKKTLYIPFDRNDKGKDRSYADIFFSALSGIVFSKELGRKERMRLFSLCRSSVKGRMKALKSFCALLAIVGYVRKNNIEHIHLHFAYDYVELALILRKLLGISYSFTVHAADIFVSPRPRLKEWADSAERIATISEFNKQYMNENLGIPLEKIKVVRVSQLMDRLSPVEDYSEEPFRIVSVGRLIEKKGFAYLIKSCRILKDKKIPFSCEICGDGPMLAELQALISENRLQDEVKLGGIREHEEILDLIRRSSCFVLACVRAKDNDMDGIPNALIEAMAMGIPTISTQISGIPELIDDGINGLLVPEKDPHRLCEAIMRIKSDQVLSQTLRSNSRKKVEQEFGAREAVNKLISIFEGRADE